MSSAILGAVYIDSLNLHNSEVAFILNPFSEDKTNQTGQNIPKVMELVRDPHIYTQMVLLGPKSHALNQHSFCSQTLKKHNLTIKL